jgi:hypothetical protein
MKNNIFNILLILISILSLSLADASENTDNYIAPDEPEKYIRLASVDVAGLLFGYPEENSRDNAVNIENRETTDADFPDDASIYIPQQAASICYEGSYMEPYFTDLMIEEVIENISLPGSNSINISDCKGLIGRTAGLYPVRTGREKITEVLDIMVERGSRPEDCRKALSSMDQDIRNNLDSSSEAIERTTLASKHRLKQYSRCLDRIRLKMEYI